MMDWQEVKDMRTLAKVKTVEELIPKPAQVKNYKWWITQIGEKEYKIIEECLQLDWTIEQACMLAGISVPSYYKHKNNNPEFARRMEIARQFPKMVARAAIQRRIRQGDAKTALDFLKLRDKNYREDARDEWEITKAPTVQFISVASNEWQNTTSPDSQMNTKQESVSEWYLNSSMNNDVKQTPWENEEQVLKNLDSLNFSNE